MVFDFNFSMDVNKEEKIKAQEWVVMFDGQIKKSEKEIDAYEHHLEVNNQKSEEWLASGFIGQISENDISVELLNYFLFKLVHFMWFLY